MSEAPKVWQILLVEDNHTDVILARKALERIGLSFDLHVATDGEAALDFLHQRGAHAAAVHPDVVFLDINLPKLRGDEVLEVLKSHAKLRRIPVVMLTGSKDARDIQRAYDRHANSYLVKRPTLREFTDVMRHVLDYWFEHVERAEVD